MKNQIVLLVLVFSFLAVGCLSPQQQVSPTPNNSTGAYGPVNAESAAAANPATTSPAVSTKMPSTTSPTVSVGSQPTATAGNTQLAQLLASNTPAECTIYMGSGSGAAALMTIKFQGRDKVRNENYAMGKDNPLVMVYLRAAGDINAFHQTLPAERQAYNCDWLKNTYPEAEMKTAMDSPFDDIESGAVVAKCNAATLAESDLNPYTTTVCDLNSK